MRHWIATFSLLLASNLIPNAGSACSVHDQFCQFQGIGRAVNHTINQNDPTAVIIGSVGSNAVDFDNHVLLPDGNGPYITSTLGYTPRADQPYIGSDEQPRHVYPTQYQIDFQNGTAQAQYTGDVTGGAYIPNPSGCTISSATYCEEVIIRGNLPDPGTPEGFVVRQTNHLYNFPNVPNPSIDVVSYGAATGRAYFKQDSHLGYSPDEVVVDGQAVRFTGIRQETLSGTGAQGAEQTYYIGYNDFDAHAAGVVVHYDQTRLVRSRVHDVQFGHVTLSDGTQSHQYDAHQRQNTYSQFDRTYDFTQLVHADTGLPALHLNDQETARWNTWSDVYGHTPTAAYQTYQQEQAEIRQLAQEQFERDLARGCLDSTCSNLRDQSVWPGVDMAMASPADVTSVSDIVGQVGLAPHPLSKNLYYTSDDSGRLFLQRQDDGRFTPSDIWFGIESAGAAVPYLPGAARDVAIGASKYSVREALSFGELIVNSEISNFESKANLGLSVLGEGYIDLPRAQLSQSEVFEPNNYGQRITMEYTMPAIEVANLAGAGYSILRFGARKLDELIPSGTIPEGVVYRRTNPETGTCYIGQCISQSRYQVRQGEHNRDIGTEHDFEIIGRANPGVDLDVLEESFIRSEGGLERLGGSLENRRYQMNDQRYLEQGGTTPLPAN